MEAPPVQQKLRRGPKGCEDPKLAPGISTTSIRRGLHSVQVEKAPCSGFSPPVCSDQLKSASKNGLFKKKNQSGELGSPVRRLGGEGLGVEVSLA